MAIVDISSLPYSEGEAIAQNLAARLGYGFIGEEIFQEASGRFNTPAPKLREAFHRMPLLLGMSSAVRKRYIAQVHAVLAEKFLAPDAVHHGPFGHLLAKGVSHVLHVRVHAKLEDRIARRAEREGTTAKKAERAILREDMQRTTIAKMVFDQDDGDTSHFDMVVNTSRMEADTAVEVIAEAAGHSRYAPMSYSLQCMQDIAQAATLKAVLADLDPDIRVETGRGNVVVRSRIQGAGKKKRADKIRKRLEGFEGVHSLEVNIVQDAIDRISGSLR